MAPLLHRAAITRR